MSIQGWEIWFRGVPVGLSHLDNFGHAIGKFPRREGLKEGRVNEDVFRLPEGADEVLSVGSVDGGLASDGGVNHGQKSGRDLHEADTAHAGSRLRRVGWNTVEHE